MNKRTIEKAVRNTIKAINTDGAFFEPVREVVQTELENQIDARRDDGKKHDDAFIDSDPIMEDINITFECSYAPDDAKKADIRELLERLADYLEETHTETMRQEHSMLEKEECGHKDEEPMDWHKKEEPNCTYCKAIAQARELLDNGGKNRTDIWHVFTNGHDEYFTPAEGGEKSARECFAMFSEQYGCARLYFRAKGNDEEDDGECIETYGSFPS